MKVLQNLLLCVVLSVTSFTQTAPAQTQSPDALFERAEGLVRDAQREIETFRKGGGKNDDPQHPAAKWVATLWEFREQNPGTRATGRATSEAIHLLVHADRFAEVTQRADLLVPDDSAWEFLPSVLVEAANLQKDHSYVIRKLQDLLEQPGRAKVSCRPALPVRARVSGERR
jgi:hypothetical protein